ncbi:MAG: hypothetical protein NXI12_13405 [Alphaproteobacteria bacterium]|jgi:membrane protein implicated in regulation of membrane protease activity|nr:hypothetical protein [Alphaproteobacteria bacterium]
MTYQQSFSGPGLMGLLRAGAAALIAAAFIALVFVLAAFLTMAALVAAGVAALGASAWWLYRKVRGGKDKSGPTILVARRGPHGWTVDGEDQARGA